MARKSHGRQFPKEVPVTRSEEKQALRRTIRQMERELTPRYREESSRRIGELALSLGMWREAETICCFVGTAREIDTRPILSAALSQGKRLCVPLCLGPGVMEMRAIETLDALYPGTLGILEPPPDAPAVSPDEIGLLLLPCLTCNHRGDRLGQGGGYYDRYLSAYQGAAVILCRERLVREEIPVEAWDAPVPWVLTERGLWEDGVPAMPG